jgi:hypothetical protein
MGDGMVRSNFSILSRITLLSSMFRFIAGKKARKRLLAWFGGNYIVNAKSKKRIWLLLTLSTMQKCSRSMNGKEATFPAQR